jgi:hypothetical protein
MRRVVQGAEADYDRDAAARARPTNTAAAPTSAVVGSPMLASSSLPPPSTVPVAVPPSERTPSGGGDAPWSASVGVAGGSTDQLADPGQPSSLPPEDVRLCTLAQ